MFPATMGSFLPGRSDPVARAGRQYGMSFFPPTRTLSTAEVFSQVRCSLVLRVMRFRSHTQIQREEVWYGVYLFDRHTGRNKDRKGKRKKFKKKKEIQK